MTFNSRQHAGQLLAEELKKRNVRPNLVYGLTRGGVVVAVEIAAAFNIPLEPLIVRKISPPGNPEFALGAVAALPGCEPSMEGSHPSISVWWDKNIVRRLGLSADWQKQQIKDKKLEISNYLTQLNFRKNHTRPGQSLRKIILVDDGAATGATMLAAIGAVRKINKGLAFRRKARPYQTIVVLPVVSTDAASKIKRQADETVILSVDPYFRAVGQYYRQFNQVSWDEVKALLQSRSEAYRKSHPRKTPQRHD